MCWARLLRLGCGVRQVYVVLDMCMWWYSCCCVSGASACGLLTSSLYTLLQPKHMGHIWAACGPHMGTWFATYGAFSTYGEENPSESTTYGQHMGNIWASFSNIWGSFKTYRSFLKHMGPFVKGLCFLFRLDTLHYSGIMFFFSLKSFANHKSGLFPIFLQNKNVCWKFLGEPKTRFIPSNLESHPLKISSWSCHCVSASLYYADDAPTVCGLDLSSLSSTAAAWRARACGSSKCPPPAKIEPGERDVETELELQLSSVFVACRIVTTIDRRWLWPRGRHGGVFFWRLSPWLKAIAKFFKGIWVSRLWSCLGLRRSAALVTDSPTCDDFFTRWVLCFCFEEIETWWVLCCSIAG